MYKTYRISLFDVIMNALSFELILIATFSGFPENISRLIGTIGCLFMAIPIRKISYLISAIFIVICLFLIYQLLF